MFSIFFPSSRSKAVEWRRMNLAWFDAYKDKDGGMVVLSYEDLVADPEAEMARVLHFLGEGATDASIRCALERKEGIYKRGKKAFNFQVFDPDLTEVVEIEEEAVYTTLGLRRPTRPGMAAAPRNRTKEALEAAEKNTTLRTTVQAEQQS
jgi:hypothetical protein